MSFPFGLLFKAETRDTTKSILHMCHERPEQNKFTHVGNSRDSLLAKEHHGDEITNLLLHKALHFTACSYIPTVFATRLAIDLTS